ncbi:MAG: hypothetical protein H0U89_11615 [Acidimicrobiia bacterium]|nr:hypothetical protein [Acidimicrobiia bacterium]
MSRARLLPIVLIAAVLLAATSTSANAKHRQAEIVSPADRTQAPRSGQVRVVIDGNGIPRSSLLVELVTGKGRSRRERDLTGQLQVSDGSLVTELEAGDLVPGRSEIRLGERRGRHGVRRLDKARFSWEPSIDEVTAGRCDVLDPSRCLLPFPNDRFTEADAASDTGRRLSLDAASMPANTAGSAIDPSEWNRNDGFSPGSLVITFVPGIDLVATGVAPVTDIGRSLDRRSPIVLLDADTGERHPFWAELDADASGSEDQGLLIRPAVNLEEGHRYVVALRDLRSADGAILPAGRPFALYRDGIPTYLSALEERRPHMESMFRTLRRAGVRRSDLYLAWDFTVASEQNLAGRLLHIRDDAFASLQGAAPDFSVTGVEDFPDPVAEPQLRRRVSGTFSVPSYLTGTGAPGSRFTVGPDDLPVRNGDLEASFICNVPRSVVGPGGAVAPARLGVYGHGLLGGNGEVNAGNVQDMAVEHNFVFCATNWIGMASEDIGNAVAILGNFSLFPTLADRVQQGILNTLFLGRLMVHASGLAASPAFSLGTPEVPVLDRSDLFYDGNSQGAIIGGAATAVAQDWTRAVLGVPGMNYSTLLNRSVDFDTYALIFEPAYPDPLDRQLVLSLVQMLWDRAEANGYAHHMTDDPYPGTPAHDVLLHVAFSDHQVANVTAEVEARTIGAAARQPALAPGRHSDVEPLWRIPAIPAYPYDGSAVVYWDSGNPPPPPTNIAPRDGEDPHEKPRRQPAARLQKSAFLRTGGAVVDTCGGVPCLAP